ncbi:autophagy-related protein 9 [Xylona heveae TC161]|uniref:Autophagy-related protein 9 n=1 Tax=Xylona heveae (strain CBS 132557 / TC161) TaxID=1328760 RepID=A0A165G8L2_XYLHT|nr:autophagy-related protein 9 [Xylona heveae TC161]KZF21871.1 autophagy-related protein 9 [Xylona heveae TC161]
MMASNLLSRLLPSAAGSPSVYETLRQQDHASDGSDIEERAGMALDEQNLDEPFHDYDLEHALADATESQVTTESTAFPKDYRGRSTTSPQAGPSKGPLGRGISRPKWMKGSPRGLDAEEPDDDVPQSLLIEGGDAARPTALGNSPSRRAHITLADPPVPGLPTREARKQWETTRTQQQLHPDMQIPRARRQPTVPAGAGLMAANPKEKAMWMWANVEDLDNFLKDVYDYFLGNGIWCIMLSRALNLLTLAFVVGFSTFLTMCIDYKSIPQSRSMSQITIAKCTKNMSGSANFLLWLFSLFWIGKLFQYILDIRRLRYIQNFYHYLLDIPDSDIQTISWQEVVARLMALRDSNPTTAQAMHPHHRKFIGSQSKQRMDAHDIANRLMRKENYLIALFNKDILDLTLPIPFLRDRPLFSKTLEWNLNLCILDFVFNERGQLRPLFLKDTHRRALSEGLRRRFLFAGIMNVICAPFIITYFMMLYFFRYFNEYKKNPAQIGSRQYTPLAEWKFREFNELWHIFQRRINMSYPFASRYIDQFPKDKTIQLSRFVAFVAGAITSILALITLIDPELFLDFEITPKRTVIFYLTLFGGIWAVARGAIPEDNLVFDPEFALNNVIEYTHYVPAQWQGRLHSDDVRKEFSMLYQMKVVIFLEELMSIIFTPFVLWFSLPKCSDRVVDFFREFTVHVDGLGYVCSFAVFDFQKGPHDPGRPRQQPTDGQHGLRDDYFSTKDGKMLASYYGFLDNYAGNPRPGAPHGSTGTKRSFHPPPAFPGLMSPLLAAEMSGAANGRPPRSATRPGTAGTSGRGPPRTPKFAPAGMTASPMPSILLDPHHQPSASGFRTVPRHGTQSRYRTSRHPLTEPIQDAEEGPSDSLERRGGVTSSGSAGGLATESNLGESWKTTRAGTGEVDEGEGEEAEALAGDKGAGVLGLIYQFQKAQTEGRGTGVNI